MTTKKKVLAILSNYGYWGVELTGPMVKLEQAGYQLTFATPNGERPIALPPSYDTNYYDPPLGVKVTTEFDAAQVMQFKDSPKLDHPLDSSLKCNSSYHAALRSFSAKNTAWGVW